MENSTTGAFSEQRSSLNSKYFSSFIHELNPTKDFKSKKPKFKQKSNHLASLNSKLGDLASKNINLDQFSQSLLTLKEIQGHKVIHLYMHEKGLQHAQHYQITSDEVKTSSENVSLFLKFYQSIKKSKNRSFGQSSLKGFPYNIIGTFMAREFTLKSHNLIFIVSREDFLDYTDNDIDFFNSLCSVLPLYFNRYLINQAYLSEGFFNEALKSIIQNELHSFPSFLQEEQMQINHQQRLHLLGELLNTLQHEISNPLFGLQLSTKTFAHQDLSTEDLETIDLIGQSISRAQKILKNFSFLYKDTQKVTTIQFEKLFQEVLILAKSEVRGIEINLEIDPNVTSIQFESNPTWIAQILFNLVINAAQALKEHEAHKRQITIKLDINNKHISVSVLDSGLGIKTEDESNIFQNFFTTKDKGTGLGLALSKKLANKLGGDLSYSNRSDSPHAFILELKR